MGLMTGRVEGNTMIVLDAYALPVQGEAAFVTAQNSGFLGFNGSKRVHGKYA